MFVNQNIIQKQKPLRCDFCLELDGQDCHFSHLYKDRLKSRIVFRNEDFVVMPTIGQIADGHLLILPFKHYTAIGELPSEKIRVLEKVIQKVRKTTMNAYDKPTVFFEHGTVGNSCESGGCGIYHMHLHAIPVPESISIVPSLNLPFEEIDSLENLKVLVAKRHSYLLLIDQKSKKYATEITHLQSQFMRKKIGEILKTKEWDWRQYGPEKELMTTFEKFSSFLRK